MRSLDPIPKICYSENGMGRSKSGPGRGAICMSARKRRILLGKIIFTASVAGMVILLVGCLLAVCRGLPLCGFCARQLGIGLFLAAAASLLCTED